MRDFIPIILIIFTSSFFGCTTTAPHTVPVDSEIVDEALPKDMALEYLKPFIRNAKNERIGEISCNLKNGEIECDGSSYNFSQWRIFGSTGSVYKKDRSNTNILTLYLFTSDSHLKLGIITIPTYMGHSILLTANGDKEVEKVIEALLSLGVKYWRSVE